MADAVLATRWTWDEVEGQMTLTRWKAIIARLQARADAMSGKRTGDHKVHGFMSMNEFKKWMRGKGLPMPNVGGSK